MSSKLTLLAALIVAIGLVVVACNGSKGGDDGPGSATATSGPGDLTLDDVQLAAEIDGLDRKLYDTSERHDEGFRINLIGPKKLEVGSTGNVYIELSNESAEFKPEKPFDITQATGQVLPGGPIAIEEIKPVSIQQALTLKPGNEANGRVVLSCKDEGSASITFNSKGQSNTESPATGYSTTAEYHFDCVLNDEDPLTFGEFSELTSQALGFSQDTLTWVAFNEGGVILRVNQIDPVEVQVGNSVEIYADFDARKAANYSGFSANATRLIDGELSFTSGGPVSIVSPPGRAAEPAVMSFDGAPMVFWGFRSATLTCESEGEAVYHANLHGKRFNGEVVHQIVSGLVDCVEKDDSSWNSLSDELDFSGVWSLRPNPGYAYTPTARDEFPNNTELYFDYQICVARIDGIRSCDLAYWSYGADWFSLTKTGDPVRTVDSFGNELFTTEYNGVYHHTHSYFKPTEIPEELLRNGKSWGQAWDLSAGPTISTFEFTGTITYIPGAEYALHVKMQGEHQGPLTYTHAMKLALSYAGPLPESETLPIKPYFSELLRAEQHAPEGMYGGDDPSVVGTFYSASVQTNGVVAGMIKPSSAAEQIDRATIELFVPGDAEPIASAPLSPTGRFEFRGLPVVRTDGKSTGTPDTFASQYRLVVSDAESEVEGIALEFQDKSVTVRPFIETTILLDPIPATHFIAVGDRGVGGVEAVYHYSLEYWDCGARFPDLHNEDGYSPEALVQKCQELNPRARPQKLGAVELLARTDWMVWAGVNDVIGSGRSWIQQDVWIAEIVYTGISATELMPIYAGTKEDVETRWGEIMTLAQDYPWAEQSGFATNSTFTQWPRSMYDPLGTNSNTFIRYLVTSAGLKMTEMDGSHPGNLAPVQNTEHDLGRLLTFYPTHTPWTGTPDKPEPSGTPPLSGSDAPAAILPLSSRNRHLN